MKKLHVVRGTRLHVIQRVYGMAYSHMVGSVVVEGR